MSRYRLYKNGIYGVRYEKMYIVPVKEDGNMTTYSIWNADKEVIREGLQSYDDAKWEIAISNATAEDMLIIQKLNATDQATIVRLQKELMESERQYTPEGETAGKWLEMVGYRKKRGLKVL